VVQRVKSYEVRSYIPKKKQKGRRDWQDKRAEQRPVYANRRRVRGEYGKSLLRRRGELIERSFAHCYETAGMRRCHLRGRQNILKRPLIHVGARQFRDLLRFMLCLMTTLSPARRLSAAGCARSQQLSQNQTQVECSLVRPLGSFFRCRMPCHRSRNISSSATADPPF
jgi:hypothetical protein